MKPPKHRACWDGKQADCPWAAIADEIGEFLKAQPCGHGAGDEAHKETPPMFYAEWIACVLAHAAQAERAPASEPEARGR